MNEDCVVPEWLHDILLGYGDPAAADYRNMEVRCGAACWARILCQTHLLLPANQFDEVD